MRRPKPEAQPADAELLQQVLGFAYTAPVEGQLSSGFGLRTDPLEGVSRFHYGLDIAAPEGAVVSSFADGTVTAVGESSELGRYVAVSHANGFPRCTPTAPASPPPPDSRCHGAIPSPRWAIPAAPPVLTSTLSCTAAALT